MARGGKEVRQDGASVAKNSGYFGANQSYAERAGSLDTYGEIRRAIGPEIAGARRLLDVGNGGVFDYDTSLVERIVGVDLFLSDAQATPAENITLRYGDALGLDEPDEAFDRVLEISVFHHLIGTDVDSTLANINQAVEEAYRVLEPGGRLVVMESCVSPRAFAIERHLFRGLRQVARTPVMRHPATLQFPPAMIAEVIRRRFGEVTVKPIPVGSWIIQFGLRWPTALTPARPYLFTATRVPQS
jgi:SAM-dependent methyltransferase